jgi:hypothetical protein
MPVLLPTVTICLPRPRFTGQLRTVWSAEVQKLQCLRFDAGHSPADNDLSL